MSEVLGVGEAERVVAAQAGDGSAFADLVEPYRRELQVHCYRMLGSFEEAEDLVQETFLRAWRKRTTFEGRSTFRAWLYRIATNACLDHLERHPRQRGPVAGGEITWLQPFPDRLLDEAGPADEQPDAVVVSKETIELVYIVAIQHLPPRQRAILVMRDVLGWPASVTAGALEVSVPAVKSALQRARTTLRQHLPEGRLEWSPAPAATEHERTLLQRYIEATERADIAALAELIGLDARLSMPAWSEVFVGREAIVAGMVQGGFGSAEFGDLRLVPTRANRQPAAANYVKGPGETQYRAFAFDVLLIEGGQIVEITAFFGPELFVAAGLPLAL